MKVSHDTIDVLLEEVDTYIPIFLQIMVKTICDEVKLSKRHASPELVHECYEEKVHGAEYRNTFEDYYERLDRYYTPENARVVKTILREMALSKKGLKKSTAEAYYVKELGKPNKDAFDQLIDTLANDFYIERGAVLSFKTKWLRDWWRKYHV